MNIQYDDDDLAKICENHDVRRLYVFGSVLTDRFDENSDLDLLVEFESDTSPSLFKLGRLQQDLTEFFDRTVDLKTPGFFSEETLTSILERSSLQYDRPPDQERLEHISFSL